MTASVTSTWRKSLLATAAALPFLLAACARSTGPDKERQDGAASNTTVARAAATEGPDEEAEIQAARAELSPEDRHLLEAQEFCPIMPDNRLGVMGTPIKVVVKDQPVFLCCKGCRRKALADPEKTLAKVEELKAKTKERQKAGG